MKKPKRKGLRGIQGRGVQFKGTKLVAPDGTYTNDNGIIHRKDPKNPRIKKERVRLSKKERLRQRRQEKADG